MSSAVIRHPAAQWGFATRSSIFLGRIDPRVKLTAMGRGGGAEGRTQRARWSLMEPYGAKQGPPKGGEELPPAAAARGRAAGA